jgi:hypothetical protein
MRTLVGLDMPDEDKGAICEGSSPLWTGPCRPRYIFHHRNHLDRRHRWLLRGFDIFRPRRSDSVLETEGELVWSLRSAEY